jgi:hypothetical protein
MTSSTRNAFKRARSDLGIGGSDRCCGRGISAAGIKHSGTCRSGGLLPAAQVGSLEAGGWQAGLVLLGRDAITPARLKAAGPLAARSVYHGLVNVRFHPLRTFGAFHRRYSASDDALLSEYVAKL